MNRCGRADRRDAGFTLLELVVAMGILTAFLVMLVQLLASGTRLVDDGERGQSLADRALAAVRAVEESCDAIVGPRALGAADGLGARLVVHRVPLVLAADRRIDVQALRATARLDPRAETALLEERVRRAIEAEGGPFGGQSLEDEIARRVVDVPRHGVGEMLLTVTPSDPEGVFFELRRGLWPFDGPPDAPALAELRQREDLVLPEAMLEDTRVLVTGVMHFDVELWSQHTTAWDAVGPTGPEHAWDSARAGLSLELREGDPDVFRLDLGPFSAEDPRDDVWPRWLRITLVVSQGDSVAAEAFLSDPLQADDREAVLSTVERLPFPEETRWLKIGPEWVRYDSADGRRLSGLRRGGRGTAALPHAAGTPVRAGRELSIVVALPHGRDGDDG